MQTAEGPSDLQQAVGSIPGGQLSLHVMGELPHLILAGQQLIQLVLQVTLVPIPGGGLPAGRAQT